MMALVLLLAGAAGLQMVRERLVPEPPAQLPTLWMHSPALLDRLSLEFDALAADVYWIRAVVYYGSARRSGDPEKNYDLLYPLLDITTTLDPQFLLAYRMGAIFLSEGYPGGPGRPDLAVALLEKGLKQSPDRWQLMHDIGFVYFWTIRDYKTAASWLERASEVPGAPVWLKPVAAGMSARGGDRGTARLMWQELLKSDADFLSDTARQRLAQLDALDQIDALHSLIARVTLATGRRPASWRDLIGEGWLRGEPRDPAGFPYVMDPVTARVTVSHESLLYPLPTDLAIPQG
jgi:hypothetical protein